MSLTALLTFGLLSGCGQAADPAKASGPQSRLAVRLDGTTLNPVGIVRQQPLPVLEVEVLPMALAADCSRKLLYAVSPVSRTADRAIVATIDASTGSAVGQRDVPHMVMRNANFVPPATLYVAGVIHADPAALFRRTPASDFFRSTHLGVRLALDTGVVEPVLAPYDHECIGAAACLDVSVVPSGSGWLASQPTSTRIAVYERAGARPLSTCVRGWSQAGSSANNSTSWRS